MHAQNDAQTVGGILVHHGRNFRSGMEKIFLMLLSRTVLMVMLLIQSSVDERGQSQVPDNFSNDLVQPSSCWIFAMKKFGMLFGYERH